MKFYASKATHYKGHRWLIVGSMVPNLLEFIFLWRRTRPAAFVGYGTKWYHYPEEKPVPKRIAKQLQSVISTMKIYR